MMRIHSVPGLTFSALLIAGCSDTTTDPPRDIADAVGTADVTTGAPDEGSADASNAADSRSRAILTLTGNVAAGEQIYLSECEACHRVDGTGVASGGIGKDLTDWLPRNGDAAAVEAILNGRAGMLAYDFLSDQEIADVLAYIRTTFDTE